MHLGGSRGDNHLYDHVAIGTKDILMGRKVYTIYTNNSYEYFMITSVITYFVLNAVHPYIQVLSCDVMIYFHLQLKDLKPKTESLKMINPKKKNGFEYSDQVSSDLSRQEVFVDMMARDYQGPKPRSKPLKNN